MGLSNKATSEAEPWKWLLVRLTQQSLLLPRGCTSTTLNTSTVVVGAVSKTTSTTSTTVIAEEQGEGLGTPAPRPQDSAAVVVEAESMLVGSVHAMRELMDVNNSRISVCGVYCEGGAADNAGPTRLIGESDDAQVGPVTKQLTEIRVGSVAVIPEIRELLLSIQAAELSGCGVSYLAVVGTEVTGTRESDSGCRVVSIVSSLLSNKFSVEQTIRISVSSDAASDIGGGSKAKSHLLSLGQSGQSYHAAN